jgi:hypothetical protein
MDELVKELMDVDATVAARIFLRLSSSFTQSTMTSTAAFACSL